jgi:hypothetical protein
MSAFKDVMRESRISNYALYEKLPVTGTSTSRVPGTGIELLRSCKHVRMSLGENTKSIDENESGGNNSRTSHQLYIIYRSTIVVAHSLKNTTDIIEVTVIDYKCFLQFHHRLP